MGFCVNNVSCLVSKRERAERKAPPERTETILGRIKATWNSPRFSLLLCADCKLRCVTKSGPGSRVIVSGIRSQWESNSDRFLVDIYMKSLGTPMWPGLWKTVASGPSVSLPGGLLAVLFSNCCGYKIKVNPLHELQYKSKHFGCEDSKCAPLRNWRKHYVKLLRDAFVKLLK